MLAKTLVDFFGFFGVPERVLSNMGTQFVSGCLKDVGRLLSIKQLGTIPLASFICNGLVELKGTFKAMLKRLRDEQRKRWHRLG